MTYPELTNDGFATWIENIELKGVGDLSSIEKGSAARYNYGKPKLSYIPMETLYGECTVWEYGEKKYTANNWKKGMLWTNAYNSMLRHIVAWGSGEDIDNESGLPHLDHAAANLRMLLYYREHYKEGDDRFKGHRHGTGES